MQVITAERPSARRTPSTNLARDLAYKPLDGKFGIVTGGSRGQYAQYISASSLTLSGIGAAIAKNLASKGCSLLLIYTSDSSAKPTETLCEQLQSTYGSLCVPLQADLSEPSRSAPYIVEAAKSKFAKPRSGDFQIDILINNAGIAGNKNLNDPEAGAIEITQFDKQYHVNVLAPLLLTQACEPYLPRDRSGRIVNVSSVSSSIGCEGQSIYAGTKAALEAMTRVWARELAERCTVNAINPGPVWGDMYAEAGQKFWDVNQKYVDGAPLMAYHGEEDIKARAGGNPEDYDKIVKEGMGSRRPGFTDEIAGVVGMLCSQESGWTTGSVICANGGMKMSIA
jgi:NAD(P)-dependent dehydrogenase (short-subunit alcohol dehydrogenase family)